MSRRARQLEGLGLTRWVPRERAGDHDGDLPEPDAEAGIIVHRAGAEPVALVLAALNGPAAPSDPRLALLDRILEALALPPARFRVLIASSASAFSGAGLAPHRLPAGPVLAFLGEGSGVDGAIALPTLDFMLADPAAKRPAWARLKPLVGSLGS